MPEAAYGGRGRRLLSFAEAALASGGMCVFALFVHGGFPLRILAGAGLLVAALAVGQSIAREPSPARLLALGPLSPRGALLLPIGLLLGAGLGAFYRVHSGFHAFPSVLRWFAVTASLVGGTEELLYRGFIQGRMRGMGRAGAVVSAAFFHAAYKCCLFALPSQPSRIDIVSLAAWTFAVGVLLGALREVSASVWPSVAAHMCFDVVVYGARAEAPWWVWS